MLLPFKKSQKFRDIPIAFPYMRTHGVNISTKKIPPRCGKLGGHSFSVLRVGCGREEESGGQLSRRPQACSSRLTLISIHRYHHRSLPGSNVAFQMKDLLPGAEDGFAVGERDVKRRPEQRGLKMGVAVAVVPGLFVSVVAAGRNELVEKFREVALESGFEFDCAHGGGAADGEDMDEAGTDAGGGGNSGDFLGEVMHVSVAGGGEGDLLLVSHGKSIKASAMIARGRKNLPPRHGGTETPKI